MLGYGQSRCLHIPLKHALRPLLLCRHFDLRYPRAYLADIPAFATLGLGSGARVVAQGLKQTYHNCDGSHLSSEVPASPQISTFSQYSVSSQHASHRRPSLSRMD